MQSFVPRETAGDQTRSDPSDLRQCEFAFGPSWHADAVSNVGWEMSDESACAQ